MIEEEELIQKLEKQNSELNLIYKKLGSLDEPQIKENYDEEDVQAADSSQSENDSSSSSDDEDYGQLNHSDKSDDSFKESTSKAKKL